MPEENQSKVLKQILKGLGITVAVILALVVVGFGLLVGVCGIMGKR